MDALRWRVPVGGTVGMVKVALCSVGLLAIRIYETFQYSFIGVVFFANG